MVVARNRAAERSAERALIMTGDVGFGAPSTFGGTIPTPSD
jgi:hypothetical protein